MPPTLAVLPSSKGADAVQASRERVMLGKNRGHHSNTPTPGTMGSVGAAGTDIATVRRQAAQDLPVPIELTKGQATRDFEQSASSARWPRTRPRARPCATCRPRAEGLYRRGRAAMTSSPLDFLNSKPGGLATTALADHARQYAVKLGVADLEGRAACPGRQRAGSGLMNAPQAPTVPIRVMEAWRKEINAATDQADPVQVRDATILKKLIDAQTEPVAGPLYRQARGCASATPRTTKTSGSCTT
jgi:hypothetical protein